MRNLQQVQVRTGSSFERICPFPVGYIYMSSNSTSPANIYGGTWSPLTDGRFWRASGSWNGTGGESTHTLTVQEMPNHAHVVDVLLQYQENAGAARLVYNTRNASQGSITTTYVGGGAAHNNLPPYRTCYCWYRTA